MEEMGRQMIKHCGGLPLAIKVLGGLLAAQHTLSEWKRISENIKSHIVGGTSFNDKNISSVYQILYLSFEELPIYLKHCFLYLAHFPEDYPIDVGKLSYYWAAEGIQKPRYYEGSTIREVSNGYMDELVKRNMVISERDATTSRFETCHLHDMMREVCLRKAEEDNFVHIVDTANSKSPCESRRITVHRLNHPKGKMMNPKLRSLLFIHQRGCVESGLCFTRLQLIRVLDLSKAQFEGQKLPSDIGKLIHLRYLSLYNAFLTHLPSSMENLKQLIYLNITTNVNSVTYIPNFLKYMRILAYLSLPRKMHDKTKLELDNLVNLETLVNFSTKHSSVKDLQRMTKLRNIECCHWVEDPMPILEKLLHLKEVHLGYESFSGRIMVCSDGGFPQLQKLNLSGLYNWEEWIVEEGSMPLLHTLHIARCEKLKELPDGLRFIYSLKNLHIDDEWEERLSEGGEDYYKVKHIPSVVFVE